MRDGFQRVVNGLARPVRERVVLHDLPRQDRELISLIRKRRLTYLSRGRLAALAKTCRNIEEAGLRGVFIEAGCALGGSTILISRIKQDARPLYVYDVFGMIPPPTVEDTPEVHQRYQTIVSGEASGIGGDAYYGYQSDLYETVKSNLGTCGVNIERQSVHLVKGLLQETMHINQPVAFAHVDVDWYEPVMASLSRIFPNLTVGGSIVLDDYHDWGGCRAAADEYLARIRGEFLLDDTAGSLKITKISTEHADGARSTALRPSRARDARRRGAVRQRIDESPIALLGDSVVPWSQADP